MRLRRAIVGLLLCACASAQQTLTLDQLLSFVRSAIKLKQPDREVAGYLAKFRLSEKLDERTVEELQGEGAGPKTVAALSALVAASASLPQPQPKVPKPPPPPIPPPSPEEQQAVISEVRDYAANYSKSLPDFICTQVTRKYVDPSGKEFWGLDATITEHLTYFDQQEHYKLMLVNNQYVDLPHESVGGASSSGEFGSLLRLTLARKADAAIEFDHWATLRKKRTYVFSYSISSGNSDYSILWEKSQRIIVGYRGLIYVDKDTHQVLRVTLHATEIPPSFPVQEASTTLDFDYADISGRTFLLPLRAEIRMRHDRFLSRNLIEFRMYRKFSADAEIKFDTPTPDALPEDQTKEQPELPKGLPPK